MTMRGRLIWCLAIVGMIWRGSGARAEDRPILTIESGGHTDAVMWLGFTPDGRYLISTGDDKVVRVWDVSRRPQVRLARTLRFQIGPAKEGMVYACALSPGGDLLALGGHTKDDEVRIVDFHTGEVMELLKGHTNVIYALAFSPDGKWLASGSYDKTLRLWARDGEQWTAAATLKGHTDVVNELAWHPSSQRLVSASDDNSLRLWRLSGESWNHDTTMTGHRGDVRSAAWSPDGRYIASAGCDGLVGIWDGGTARLLGTLPRQPWQVYSVVFSPDSRFLVSTQGGMGATGTGPPHCRVWSVSDWTELRRFHKHDDSIQACTFSPDSRLVASAGGGKRDIYLWSPATGQIEGHIVGSGRPVKGLGFSPDGRTVAFCQKIKPNPYDEATKLYKAKQYTDAALAYAKAFEAWPGSFWSAYQAACCYSLMHDRVNALAWLNKAHDAGFRNAGHIRQDGDWDALRGDPEFSRTVDRMDGEAPAEFADPLRPQLERTFDLFDITLGPDIDSAAPSPTRNTQHATRAPWLRARRSFAGLTLKGGNMNILTVLRGKDTVAQIKRPSRNDMICCSCFAPDGKLVVSSNYSLTLHDATNGKKLREFVGHTGPVLSVVVGPNGRFLLSGSTDQTFRLWNLETGELLLSVFVGADREWVAWCPQGYYKSSPGGDKLIGWHLNQGPDKAARYVHAWQMRRRLERPDIVERIPSAGSVALAVKWAQEDAKRRAQPTQTVANLQRQLPPTVTMVKPSDGTRVTSTELRVRAVVKSDLPLRKVTVTVNGRPTRGFGGTTAASRLEQVDQTVTLVEGENVIQVSAESEAGLSMPATVRVKCARPKVMKPDLYVLAVGVSSYEDESLALKHAAADARGLADAFGKQKGGMFNRVESRVLVDDQATRRNVLKGLRWLRKSVTQRDMAIVSVAGHGKKDEDGSFFFIPYDGERDDLWSSCVRWTEFGNALGGLPCKVMLAMDTCHSGAVTGGRRTRGDVDMTQVIKDLTSADVGVVTFTASTGKEESQEADEWGHGAFTLAMIEALTGKHVFDGQKQTPLPADFNNDGVILIDEMGVYVMNRVKELTKGAQHPTLQKGDVPSFPMALTR